ncbi:12473_t:CDS:2 [Funneliformis geosporum]|nr:12473_t:CDS:2 [Funneliformis geosporum]
MAKSSVKDWLQRVGKIVLPENANLQGYCHKDFHSRNILQDYNYSYISDFGLTGPADNFGVIMAEYLSGNPPFYNRKHDVSLALDVCNRLRPDFGKGTPEFYKKLAYRCYLPNKLIGDIIKYYPHGEQSIY